MVVLAIQKFHNPRVGCCGAVRHYSIYPASESIGEFIGEAKKIISNYGTPSYFSENDTYYLEYFIGSPGQEDRGSGKSLYKIEKNEETWSLYLNEKFCSEIIDPSDLDRI